MTTEELKIIVASILPSERLGFYIGGSWQEEKKLLGIDDDNNSNYFDKNYSLIMAERARIMAEAIVKAITRMSDRDREATK